MRTPQIAKFVKMNWDAGGLTDILHYCGFMIGEEFDEVLKEAVSQVPEESREEVRNELVRYFFETYDKRQLGDRKDNNELATRKDHMGDVTDAMMLMQAKKEFGNNAAKCRICGEYFNNPYRSGGDREGLEFDDSLGCTEVGWHKHDDLCNGCEKNSRFENR